LILTKEVWTTWANRQRNTRPTALMYHSQLHKVNQMPSDTPQQLEKKAEAKSKFDSKVVSRQKDFKPMKASEVTMQKGYVPQPIQFLANEMLAVGA
jgi:hypothetical protein